ncbi:MAG: PLP-dependent aminotransferase family protein, partial [Kangiellaceae bacterium]|nr:PLP-dependent aminotransferase family protein [Kangiellaceae bacterium]
KLFQDIMVRGAAFDILPSAERSTPSNNLIILNRHIGRATRQQSNIKANYYDNPLGDETLRQQISLQYRERYLRLDPDEICITSGCQNAIFMALMSTCQPGDNVAVESPAFYGVLQLLESLGLNIIEIPSHPDSGIDVEALTAAARRWSIKALVITPSFATPSGACIPRDNCQQIIEIANQKDIVIIEDDIYGELGFQSQLSPIKSLDSDNRVILCGSFSKCLSRDLRIGWIIGGQWHTKIIQLKLVTLLASNQAQQQGLASYLAEGCFRRHLISFRQTLQLQRDQLIDTLNQYWPDSIRYHIPEGGLAIWVQLPAHINTANWYFDLIDQGITLTPGMLFSAENQFKNYLRLSFNRPIIPARKNAIRKLAKMFEMSKFKS